MSAAPDPVTRWLGTPIDIEVPFRGRARRLSRLPYLGRVLGEQSTARGLLDQLGGLLVLVGGLLLLSAGTEREPAWTGVQIEIGGALLLFGFFSLIVGRHPRPATRVMAWVGAAVAGLAVVWLTVEGVVTGVWADVLLEVGVGAVLFLVLEKLVGEVLIHRLDAAAEAEQDAVVLRPFARWTKVPDA